MPWPQRGALNGAHHTENKISKKSIIMQELIAKMTETMAAIQADLTKVDNKAAQARVRKLTLDFEKLGKQYRKETVK